MTRIRDILGTWGLFTLWLILVSVPCMFLSAWHHAPLRGPEATQSIQVNDNQDETKLAAWHFIALDCPCSQSILTQLQARPVHPDYQEHLVLIAGDLGDDENRQLKQGGWNIIQKQDADRICLEFDIRGAPWFMITDESKQIRYSGGYAQQRPQFFVKSQDQLILNQVQSTGHAQALPAYGCAIGQNIKEQIDPLSIQYGKGFE